MKNIAMKQQCSTNAKWSMARSGCGTNSEPRNVASTNMKDEKMLWKDF